MARKPRNPRAPATGRRLTIHTPEGVPIGFTLASLGGRLGAQIVDILLTYGGLFLLFWLLLWAGVSDWDFLMTLFVLLIFLIRTPYYILSELIWNGRTLGKRAAKIRVISANGQRLSAYQVTARNLMKEAEVFLPLAVLFSFAGPGGWVRLGMALWVLGVLLVPVFNRRNQRLGDMIAGTLVVDRPAMVLLPDLAAQGDAAAVGFRFDRAQLDIYGRYELQALERILREPPKLPAQQEALAKVVRTIARKIGWSAPIPPADHWDFLGDFYRQQREYLESRHLFGDTRDDKFHARPDADSGPETAAPRNLS